MQGLLDADSSLAAGFARARYLVLDEADRLLEPSFEAELRGILSVLPAQRQTLLFSATMTRSLVALQSATFADAFHFEVPPAGAVLHAPRPAAATRSANQWRVSGFVVVEPIPPAIDEQHPRSHHRLANQTYRIKLASKLLCYCRRCVYDLGVVMWIQSSVMVRTQASTQPVVHGIGCSHCLC